MYFYTGFVSNTSRIRSTHTDDGLPAEFVLGKGGEPPTKTLMEAMPYTQSLLADGRAKGYHAVAAPPTVTMPRLKAMVSGAIGGFLDVALNFNTQAFLDDNLLDQFYRIGWKMVMLGDETWIKLFPRLFTRQDGVSSFYVKDTVQVDLNVSRHLEVELAADDWNVLILHYLGLDHVGHIGGRSSTLMAPKMEEMDDIIKMIHMRSIDKRTLFVVVSDHGMTDSGNHGGSSYEETDSLALFINGGTMISGYAPSAQNSAAQVDIAPTLALLLGVPIPKNNFGILLLEVLNSWTDKQRLRALELNSWQLLRLVQAHLPGLLCEGLCCRVVDGHGCKINGAISNTQEKLCHLFSQASAAHNLWKLRHSDIMTNNSDELRVAIESYYDFLRNASEWLSHRATDKPISILLIGVAIMFISCSLLLNLLFWLFKEVYSTPKQSHFQLKEWCYSWHMDEAFILLGTFIYVLSFGASSMVEEEQYTWHFLGSTLYMIILFMTIQSLLKQQTAGSIKVLQVEGENASHQLWRTDACSNGRFTNCGFPPLKNLGDYQISSILIVLICGRILRGWHQGGVNWVDLPDISKLLEQAGASSIKYFHIISLFLLMILKSLSLGLVKPRRKIVIVVTFGHLLSGSLVLLHIMENHGDTVVNSSTLIAQLFFVTIGMTVVATVIISPWILPVHHHAAHLMRDPNKDSLSLDVQIGSLLLAIRDSMYLIGMTSTASWCLLQLLLQQPINAVPVLLIFLQLTSSIIYFSAEGSCRRQWVEVAAMHFLGMMGHFGLGNSNSIATIDVAGAFTGISSYSTVLSGILMFIITYASPILSSLSIVTSISTKDVGYLYGSDKLELGCILQKMLAFPCLLPLVLNSIVLTSFTIVLLLMRNHLFVWSVFSPKYLYVVAGTASVYFGVYSIAAIGVYVCTVTFFRAKLLHKCKTQ